MTTIYKYDKNALDYVEVKTFKWLSLAVLFLIAVVCLSSFAGAGTTYLNQERTVSFDRDKDFSKEALVEEIKRLGLEHPEIVMAQALTESAHFKHPKFTLHSNLFGMRRSGSRVSSASQFDDSGFAIYKNWHESIQDYGYLQSAFARGLTKKEYYMWLSQYCPDKGYDTLIWNVVQDNDLDKLFE